MHSIHRFWMTLLVLPTGLKKLSWFHFGISILTVCFKEVTRVIISILQQEHWDVASRQASNQGKIQSRAPESWSCASSAPSISSLPQLPAFPHHVSHLHRAEAEPRGLGFFGFILSCNQLWWWGRQLLALGWASGSKGCLPGPWSTLQHSLCPGPACWRKPQSSSWLCHLWRHPG